MGWTMCVIFYTHAVFNALQSGIYTPHFIERAIVTPKDKILKNISQVISCTYKFIKNKFVLSLDRHSQNMYAKGDLRGVECRSSTMLINN